MDTELDHHVPHRDQQPLHVRAVAALETARLARFSARIFLMKKMAQHAFGILSPVDALLRLAADLVQVADACSRSVARRELEVEEIDGQSVILARNGDNVSHFARAVTVKHNVVCAECSIENALDHMVLD